MEIFFYFRSFVEEKTFFLKLFVLGSLFLFPENLFDLFGVRRVVVLAAGERDNFSTGHQTTSAASLFLLFPTKFLKSANAWVEIVKCV